MFFFHMCHAFIFCIKVCKEGTYILCNQLLLQALTQMFETLQNVNEHIGDVHEVV